MDIHWNNDSEICEVCHIGRVTRRMLTYTERFHGELILIPNIPGRACSHCGDTQYDSSAMNILQQMLWADLGIAAGARATVRTYAYRIGTLASRPGKDSSSPD